MEVDILGTKDFRATNILSAVGVDVYVNRSIQSYQNSVKFNSWYSCGFQSYLIPGRRYVFRSFLEPPNSCQQWELIFLLTLVFRATKILSTLRAPIQVVFRVTEHMENAMLPVAFWIYQKPVNNRS